MLPVREPSHPKANRAPSGKRRRKCDCLIPGVVLPSRSAPADLARARSASSKKARARSASAGRSTSRKGRCVVEVKATGRPKNRAAVKQE